jgi:hypothetical protein
MAVKSTVSQNELIYAHAGGSLRRTDAELTVGKKRRVAEPLIDETHSSFQSL